MGGGGGGGGGNNHPTLFCVMPVGETLHVMRYKVKGQRSKCPLANMVDLSMLLVLKIDYEVI